MSDIWKIVRRDHQWKMEGLAKYVLDKPTKEDRRKFLDKFLELHGQTMRSELEVAILNLHKLRLGSPAPNQPRQDPSVSADPTQQLGLGL